MSVSAVRITCAAAGVAKSDDSLSIVVDKEEVRTLSAVIE